MLITNFSSMSWQFRHNYIDQYMEQRQVVKYLKKNNIVAILTENQFSYFSFYNTEKPTSKYLYITEINNQNNQAEKEAIEILKNNKNIVVLWPKNEDFSSAKLLQQYVLENYQAETFFPKLDLVIYSKK